ncbi:MAG TPA: hypothetical protein VJU60_04215 [Thermoleophilaceae bacterium]|nr:hypothetical protein [Thermoleophilaceae bacterium]
MLLLTTLALLPLPPWAFITVLGTDSGWEDAVWRYSSWAKTLAWVALVCGLGAACATFVCGARLREGRTGRDRLWMRLSLAVEAAPIVAWIVFAHTAP